jgi:uncharacterized Zn-finger protein
MNPLKPAKPAQAASKPAATAAAPAHGLVELGANELPAFCPNRQMSVWNQHPRVFLDISSGQVACPYCGTQYRLKPGTVVKGH